MSPGNNKIYFTSWEKISIICYGKYNKDNDLFRLSEEENEYLQIIKGILSEKYNSKRLINQNKTYIDELNTKFEKIEDIDVRLLATVLFKTLVNNDLAINVPQIAKNANKNKFFSGKFLKIIGEEKDTIYKSYEDVANLLKLNQGKVFGYLQDYDGTKNINYFNYIKNIKSTLNFNLGLFTPINYCIYRETTEPIKAAGILNKFIEAAEKNEYLQTLVPNGMFSKKNNNLKKELIIKDIINYIPSEKYEDLYYHKKKGYIYNSNENKFIFKSRKKKQEIYISSLGFAIFIKADIKIIEKLIKKGADFRNVFKMDGYASDALVFISVMINVFLKEHLESIIKINGEDLKKNNGKDFKIKNYIPDHNNIFNLILKDSNGFYDELEKKYNKSLLNFTKNEKELLKRNNLKEIYSTLFYFKSLFKYFLQLYYKKTNLNLLGHKGYRAAEIATKGFYGHFLKMTTVNAINSIRKNLDKNSEESKFLKNYMKSLNNQIKERKEEIKNNKYMTRMMSIFKKSQKSQNTTQSTTSGLAKLAKFGNRLGSTVSFNFDLENAFYVLTWFNVVAFKLWCIIYSLQSLKNLSLKTYRGATKLIQRNYIISNIEEFEKKYNQHEMVILGGKKVVKKKPIKKTVKKPVKKIIKKSPTKKKITTKKSTK